MGDVESVVCDEHDSAREHRSRGHGGRRALQVPPRCAGHHRGHHGRAADRPGRIDLDPRRTGGTVEIGGFAVNQMKTWKLQRRGCRRREVMENVLGQPAERLRLRPPGLLRARGRLHPQRRRHLVDGSKGAQEPRADQRHLRIGRDRPRGVAALPARGCAASGRAMAEPDPAAKARSRRRPVSATGSRSSSRPTSTAASSGTTSSSVRSSRSSAA